MQTGEKVVVTRVENPGGKMNFGGGGRAGGHISDFIAFLWFKKIKALLPHPLPPSLCASITTDAFFHSNANVRSYELSF